MVAASFCFFCPPELVEGQKSKRYSGQQEIAPNKKAMNYSIAFRK
jgi:hypothetical protein